MLRTSVTLFVGYQTREKGFKKGVSPPAPLYLLCLSRGLATRAANFEKYIGSQETGSNCSTHVFCSCYETVRASPCSFVIFALLQSTIAHSGVLALKPRLTSTGSDVIIIYRFTLIIYHNAALSSFIRLSKEIVTIYIKIKILDSSRG